MRKGKSAVDGGVAEVYGKEGRMEMTFHTALKASEELQSVMLKDGWANSKNSTRTHTWRARIGRSRFEQIRARFASARAGDFVHREKIVSQYRSHMLK